MNQPHLTSNTTSQINDFQKRHQLNYSQDTNQNRTMKMPSSRFITGYIVASSVAILALIGGMIAV